MRTIAEKALLECETRDWAEVKREFKGYLVDNETIDPFEITIYQFLDGSVIASGSKFKYRAFGSLKECIKSVNK